MAQNADQQKEKEPMAMDTEEGEPARLGGLARGVIGMKWHGKCSAASSCLCETVTPVDYHLCYY